MEQHAMFDEAVYLSTEQAMELGEALLDATFDAMIENVPFGVAFIRQRAVALPVIDTDDPTVDSGVDFMFVVQV
jgi:hypothetical protein